MPPTGKEMIRAIFRVQDIGLFVGQFCINVGTEGREPAGRPLIDAIKE